MTVKQQIRDALAAELSAEFTPQQVERNREVPTDLFGDQAYVVVRAQGTEQPDDEQVTGCIDYWMTETVEYHVRGAQEDLERLLDEGYARILGLMNRLRPCFGGDGLGNLVLDLAEGPSDEEYRTGRAVLRVDLRINFRTNERDPSVVAA